MTNTYQQIEIQRRFSVRLKNLNNDNVKKIENSKFCKNAKNRGVEISKNIPLQLATIQHSIVFSALEAGET